jgi:cell wall-associated NlpC family hydrolase
LVAAGVFGLTTLDHADAAPRSKSEVVAAEADRALDALAGWQATQSPADYVRFVQARQLTASLTATDLEIDPELLNDEWKAAGTKDQQAVLAALSQLGVPYRSLRSEPGVGFDCSGLTIWAFDQAGLALPRRSGDQIRVADQIEQHDAQAGDLVYYPGHVGIYLGADMMVHSPNTGNHVEARGLPTKHSLRFGDLAAVFEAQAALPVEQLPATLVDGAGSVTQ